MHSILTTVRKYRFELLSLLLGFLPVLWFYGDLLVAPNDYMFSSTGDGIKNYYTFAYQLEHGESWLDFQGMNYPYGEHLFYTDAHPSLLLILQQLPFAGSYAVGILNLLMLLSIPAAALCMYLIFRESGFKGALAALSAATIIFMCPIIWRLGGHYSLGYYFFIPLAIYLIIRYIKSPEYHRMFKYGGLTLIAFLTHPYIGLTLTGTVVLALITHMAISGSWRSWRHSISLGVAGILPLLIFVSLNFITDDHTNRIEEPIGFYIYHATPESILVPAQFSGENLSPLRHFMAQIVRIDKQDWEGWAYLGAATIFTLEIALLIVLINFIRRKSRFRKILEHPLTVIAVPAFLFLLFSMCLPFRWGLEGLADSIGTIRQFRALGRFSWVFYFFATACAALWLSRIKFKWVAYLALLLFSALNLLEGWTSHRILSENIHGHPNLFIKSNLSDDLLRTTETIAEGDYQAILPLPFYHYGSEYFMLYRLDGTTLNSQILSYHTGLPLISSALTRGSLTESSNILEILTPSFVPKAVKFSNDKPILVVLSPGYLPPAEEEFLKRLTPIETIGTLGLYSISPEELLAVSSPAATQHYTIGSSFQEHESSKTLDCKGGIEGKLGDMNFLLSIPIESLDTTRDYVASVWHYHAGPAGPRNMFIVEEGDRWITKPTEEISQEYKGWSLTEIVFRPKPHIDEYKVLMFGKEGDKSPVWFDRVLVYPRNAIVKETDPCSGLEFTNNFIVNP